MSKIEIDFNSIKYNLYEILNVTKDVDEQKIKKSFMKIIKNFHPDKNSELEEDIYYHIILANQILLNSDGSISNNSLRIDGGISTILINQ
jgi:DnaJ-class molecular chaperone